MARQASKPDSGSSSTATIGFEAKPWITADKLRNNMDAAEYERVPAPYKGRILDPACGSAGMVVQLEKFAEPRRGTFRCGLSFN